MCRLGTLVRVVSYKAAVSQWTLFWCDYFIKRVFFKTLYFQLCCINSFRCPLKKIFSKDVHIFEPFGLVTWPFICITVTIPHHFYGQNQMNRFYLDYPLTLVRWNNEVEIAVLTFKCNVQNLQSIFPIALRTVMSSDPKLYAANSEDWFYHCHLFLGYVGDSSGAPNSMISHYSWPVYSSLPTHEGQSTYYHHHY